MFLSQLDYVLIVIDFVPHLFSCRSAVFACCDQIFFSVFELSGAWRTDGEMDEHGLAYGVSVSHSGIKRTGTPFPSLEKNWNGVPVRSGSKSSMHVVNVYTNKTS
jgi:hypothetical protein